MDGRPPTYYADNVRVHALTHSFVLDFALTDPEGRGEAAPVSRIYLSPHFAKALSAVLHDLVERYEQENGQLNAGRLDVIHDSASGDGA